MTVWNIFENTPNGTRLFMVKSTRNKAEDTIKEMGWNEGSYTIEEWDVDSNY